MSFLLNWLSSPCVLLAYQPIHSSLSLSLFFFNVAGMIRLGLGVPNALEVPPPNLESPYEMRVEPRRKENRE